MKEITLGRQPEEVKVLRVNIGEEHYDVPLGGMLKPRELAALDTNEKIMAFFGKHIPKKVIENFCMDDYNALANAWVEATAEASGVPMGE